MDKETLTGKISELDLKVFLDSIAEVFWTAEESRVPERAKNKEFYRREFSCILK